eukprot:7378848-Prymnesium_polylepis.2
MCLCLSRSRAWPLGVRSGGMYNTRWPGTAAGSATGAHAQNYDGTIAYAFAKRGQVPVHASPPRVRK